MHSSQILPTEDLDRLAKLITGLFEKWDLSTDERQRVLNRTFDNRDMRVVLSSDDLPRVVCLLNIHACLRLLFPRNPDMRYRWIKLSNQYFQQRSPLAVIIDEGIVGMETVVRYLRSVCQH